VVFPTDPPYLLAALNGPLKVGVAVSLAKSIRSMREVSPPLPDPPPTYPALGTGVALLVQTSFLTDQ